MKVHATHFLVGTFFILLGVLFLISTFGYLRLNEEYTTSIIFLCVGVVLVLAHFLFQKKVWALILGTLSIFIGTSIYIDESRILHDESIGMLFFILLGLLFLNALRSGKRNWWALIPGGLSFVFACHILLDMNWRIPDTYHGVLFFGGFGLIFAILYLLKDTTYRLDWAKYPSMIGFAIAVLFLFAVDFRDVFSRFIFPIILIGIGAFMLVKSLKSEKEVVKSVKKEKVKSKEKNIETKPED